MENLSIWVGLGLLALFVVFLGYRRSKTGYLIFIIVIGLVALFASKLLGFVNGDAVGNKYSELTGSTLEINPLGDVDPFGPFSAVLDKVNYSTDYSQIVIVLFLTALFFIGQFVKMIANIIRKVKPEESQRKRRKRVLKNYGLKSIVDIQKLP